MPGRNTSSSPQRSALSVRRTSTQITRPPRRAIRSKIPAPPSRWTKLDWLTAGLVPKRTASSARSKSGMGWITGEPCISEAAANLLLQSWLPALKTLRVPSARLKASEPRTPSALKASGLPK